MSVLQIEDICDAGEVKHMPPSRSDRYYYDTVVFEVEGTLYRVGKYGFVNWSQSVFRDMFSLPQSSGVDREGDSDENPIKLSGCTRSEFESLLDIFYPREGPEVPELSKEQWVGVLKLGRLWDMPKAATIAIEKLNGLSLTAIEKVQLGKAHGVPAWLKEGYTSLIQDVSAFSFDDLKVLGLETAARIILAQNQVHIFAKEGVTEDWHACDPEHKYYYDTAVFEVEGTLYRVAKYPFVKWSRSVFPDMFSLPQGSGDNREGETDENPIRLPGCTKLEFENLLDVLHPVDHLGIPTLSKEEWINILKLARLWDMPKIATVSIEQLSALDLTPVEKVYLGKAHGVPQWLRDGYMALMLDISQLRLDDMKVLGWETTCRILWAQNKMGAGGGVRMDPGCIPVPWTDLRCYTCVKSGQFSASLGSEIHTGGCSRCGAALGNSNGGWGAYIMSSSSCLPGSRISQERCTSDREPSQNTTLLEVFGEEIDGAERRNTS
ncbi:hypothetical protein NMY22_g18181 [Coprinellus aureogranulatus]|nr:hypothetical protein NMY22_g18181 [Coprinellus aureogranulatus]